jgi:uncharacterized protein (TIGR00369 family)
VSESVPGQCVSLVRAMRADQVRFPDALMAILGFEDVVDIDADSGTVRIAYAGALAFAHSGGTAIQGGFIAAWLDNAMAIAVFAKRSDIAVASFEIKVSFLERVAPGRVIADATILRMGTSAVFLEARLRSEDGRLLATASSSGKLLQSRT